MTILKQIVFKDKSQKAEFVPPTLTLKENAMLM